MENEYAFLECVKSGGKLRVRITALGYFNDANCQFPRNIRAEGRKYKVPVNSIKLARGPAGKYFYRIKKDDIITLSDDDIKINIKKIYEEPDETCIICMDDVKELVIVPCGHYNMCKNCSQQIFKTTKKCPCCRTIIE